MTSSFERFPIRLDAPRGKEYLTSLAGNFLLLNTVPQAYEVEYTSSYSIKFVIGGRKFYRVSGVDFELGPSQYIVVNDGSKVRFSNDKLGPVLSIFLSNELISDITNARRGHGTDLPKEVLFYEDLSLRSVTRNNTQTFRNVVQQWSGSSDEIDPDLYYRLGELLLGSHEEACTRIERIDSLKPSTKKELYRRVHTAIEFIRDNFKKPFCLDDVASAACVSKYHLIKYFRQVTSLTPNEFQIQERISLAKRLLMIRGTVAEIARECGYPDVPSFCKQFKKVAGVRPGDFRKRSAVTTVLSSSTEP